MKGPKVVVADYGDFTRPAGYAKILSKKKGKPMAAKKVSSKKGKK